MKMLYDATFKHVHYFWNRKWKLDGHVNVISMLNVSYSILRYMGDRQVFVLRRIHVILNNKKPFEYVLRRCEMFKMYRLQL